MCAADGLTSLLRNALDIPLYLIGLVLAWQTDAEPLFDPGNSGLALGWFLIGAGALPVIIGHVQLGWRTYMPSLGDALMDRGLYAHVRHPIYGGGLAIIAGLALLQPGAPWLLACALSAVFFIPQARLADESEL